MNGNETIEIGNATMSVGIETIAGLLIFLGLTFALIPRIGMNVFGMYSESETTPQQLKKARILGGVAALIGLGMFWMM